MDWITAIITIGSVIVGATFTFIFDFIKTKAKDKTDEQKSGFPKHG